MKKTTVTHEDLLHGAIYALEQAGRHLHCAVNLWNAGDYAHGLMIGVFAREELGRFKLLRKEREIAKISGPRNVSDIEAVLQHKAKLRAGVNGVTLRYRGDEPELAGLKAPIFSPEWRAARAVSDARMLEKSEKQPDATHRARLRAQYVDLLEDGTWSRPSQIDADESCDLIEDFANDYAHPVRHLFKIGVGDPWDELTQAIEAWPDAPTLPQPVWPDRLAFWAKRRAEPTFVGVQ